MKEIGAKLRAAREAKNITLLEIQEQTKIRLRYLEAIESGNWEVIPGEVYRRGFICNYANAVGLDGEALLHEYSNAKAPQPVEPAPKATNSHGSRRSPSKAAKGKVDSAVGSTGLNYGWDGSSVCAG
jgi:cytoskeleton protein RodZ